MKKIFLAVALIFTMSGISHSAYLTSSDFKLMNLPPAAVTETVTNDTPQPRFVATPTYVATTTSVITVNLPQNATISLDGQNIQNTYGVSRIVTPPLEVNETYVYTIKVCTDVSCKIKKIVFKAGDNITVNFEEPRTNFYNYSPQMFYGGGSMNCGPGG